MATITTILEWKVRVLQHDTADQIKIGAAFTTKDLEADVKSIIAGYDKVLEHAGGAMAGFKKYYKRVALVDADTFKELISIYKEEE